MIQKLSPDLARFCGYHIIIFCVIFLMINISNAQPNTNSYWHISAKELSYDNKNDQYTAKGEAVIWQEPIKITADYIIYSHKFMKASAFGNVFMTDAEDILTGNKIEIDLKTKTGTLYDGTIFIKENHFYLKGKKIQKTGISSYIAEKITISTCDGDKPAWKLTGKDLRVQFEGMGFVKHAALWFNEIPVFYSPVFAFPVKQSRQSGFLSPEIGFSDRKGMEYVQPWYWAINKSSDATFYAHYMKDRGNKLGAEYRYILDKDSKGTLMYDFLDDKKVDDGSLNSSEDWGYYDTRYVTDVTRPNSERYWFRMKHDQTLSNGFFAKLDLDIVSDQDYLHEFKDGYTGFNKTKDYFYKKFGRMIDDYDDPVRINRLNINKIGNSYSFNSEIKWYDNVIEREHEDINDTFHKLPSVNFTTIRQDINDTPFVYNFASDYTYWYREDGMTGHKVELYPRIYAPFRYKNSIFFEPSLGLRESVWHIDNYDIDLANSNDRSVDRTLYDVKLDLSSDLFKIYNINGEKFSKIKHTIKTQVTYDYIPHEDQSDLPDFGILDIIERQNSVTYSLINFLTSKIKNKTNNHSSIETNSLVVPEYTYWQFARFKLEQSYDINEAKEDDPLKWSNQESKRPFSPISGELQLNLNNNLNIIADTSWSQYDNEFTSYNIAINMISKYGNRIFAEYRNDELNELNIIESFYVNYNFLISDRLSVYGEYERNLDLGQDVQSGLGVSYQSQCWSVMAGYSDDDDEKKMVFLINLHGLGNIKSSLSEGDI